MCVSIPKSSNLKEIALIPLHNGVLLECHCVKTYFPTIEAACAAIIRYYAEPEAVQKEYVGEHA